MPLLGVWALVLSLPTFGRAHRVQGADWAMLRTGGRIILGLDANVQPLHLYAARPDLQVGPPSLALNGTAQWLFARHGGDGGDFAVLFLMIICAVAAAWALGDVALRLTPLRSQVTLVAQVLMVAVWSVMGGWGHLEDSLALTAVLFAARWVLLGRVWLVGIALGFAVANKPWAILAAPLFLGLPSGRVRAAAVATAVAALPWLPFFLADANTWRVTHWTWPVVAASALHALGVPVSATSPVWLRPAQLIGGVAAAAIVGRRSWLAAPAIGFAVKLALDPVAYPYYGLVPVVGAALLDVRDSDRLPWWTLSAVLVEMVAPTVLPAGVEGSLRLAFAVAMAFGSARGWRLGHAVTMSEAPGVTQRPHTTAVGAPAGTD